MGILNVTPDSFSDGGLFAGKDRAVRHALSMVRDGADIIDVGGESTRPGADTVGSAEEISRVVGVIRALSKRTRVPISIDTRKAEVADAAVAAGAVIVNDVSGLRYDREMAPLAAKRGVRVIIMHSRGAPKDMQRHPRYDDVVEDVIEDLQSSVGIARLSGIREEAIMVDPGIGFGKTLEHNLEILNRFEEFGALGLPVCAGVSRKSFIGKIAGAQDPSDRLPGTIAACAIAILKGAYMIRVHDVREAVQASRVADAIVGRGL